MVLVPGKSRKNYLPVDTNDPVKAEEIEESQPYVSVVNEGSPSPDTQASYPDVEEKFTRNFRVNREMREKFCVYNPFSDEF